MSGPLVIHPYRAQDGGAPVVPVVIHITEPLPEVKDLKTHEALCNKEAEQIVEALCGALPQGILDRVCGLLMQKRASLFAIPMESSSRQIQINITTNELDQPAVDRIFDRVRRSVTRQG